MTQHSGVPRRHPELERLICAAVSNHQFAVQLITAPAMALEHFEGARLLSPAERALVTSVNGATDIYEFAARLHACVQSSVER